MGRVFAFAFTAALNPTLLAAVTLMLTLPSPKRLLLGYLLGALVTSITCGLVLVFVLADTSTSSTTQHSVSPAIDLVLGALLLLVVFVIGTGRDRRRRAWSERRRERAADKPPPRWKRTLSKGSARDTFVIGILLTFPGASYIAGMNALDKQNLSTPATVLSVLVFNMIMLLLLEVPLLGYAIKPQATGVAVERFSKWLSHNGGRAALIGGGAIGAALVVRGLLYLL
jgi:hypothetical protein